MSAEALERAGQCVRESRRVTGLQIQNQLVTVGKLKGLGYGGLSQLSNAQDRSQMHTATFAVKIAQVPTVFTSLPTRCTRRLVAALELDHDDSMWSQQQSINPLLPTRYRVFKEQRPIQNCWLNLGKTPQCGLKSGPFFNPRGALVWRKVKTLRRKTGSQSVKALRRRCREEV